MEKFCTLQGSTDISCVVDKCTETNGKCLQDSVYQKLLKSVHFTLSYAKNNGRVVFCWKHGLVYFSAVSNLCSAHKYTSSQNATPPWHGPILPITEMPSGLQLTLAYLLRIRQAMKMMIPVTMSRATITTGMMMDRFWPESSVHASNKQTSHSPSRPVLPPDESLWIEDPPESPLPGVNTLEICKILLSIRKPGSKIQMPLLELWTETHLTATFWACVWTRLPEKVETHP